MKGDLYTEKEVVIKRIKIGKTIYKIYKCKVLKFNNKNYFGFIDYPTKSIFLKKDKDIKETLNHEITHAFIYEIYKNKKIGHKRIVKELRSYEPFIKGLSFLISQSFKLK